MDKQEIKDTMENLKKELSRLEKLYTGDDKNKPKSKVFIPNLGDKYYFIFGTGGVCNNWLLFSADYDRYDIGNCFETAEDAEFEVERLRVIAELKRFAEEHNEPLDWSDFAQHKYYICYDTEIKHIDYYATFSIKRTDIYFSSKELAQQAVAKIGEDRIKKYYLVIGD